MYESAKNELKENNNGFVYLFDVNIIDKISSLSCQKVAYSITSPKIGGNAAKQTSVLLRNTSEYIRCYPSSYCAV